jgi:hypothetical protein
VLSDETCPSQWTGLQMSSRGSTSVGSRRVPHCDILVRRLIASYHDNVARVHTSELLPFGNNDILLSCSTSLRMRL